jgi:hypothetical protein
MKGEMFAVVARSRHRGRSGEGVRQGQRNSGRSDDHTPGDVGRRRDRVEGGRRTLQALAASRDDHDGAGDADQPNVRTATSSPRSEDGQRDGVREDVTGRQA